MKKIIIGGNFGDTPKRSSIVDKIARLLTGGECINGGTMAELKAIDIKAYDLVIWMGNISNDEEKYYPRKKIGATLICSKLLHDDVTDVDAVSRIFTMNANAVIAIDTTEKPFSFKLIDALGNVHANTAILYDVVMGIESIAYFQYAESKRIGTLQLAPYPIDIKQFDNIRDIENLVSINRGVAQHSEEMGGRYFGNTSTRCSKMFPSSRVNKDVVLVSRRNIDKERLEVSDLVLVSTDEDTGKVLYSGENKPSVDTPIQLEIYKKFPEINFMIHGHYYIYDAPFTENHFPCGDMGEVKEITDIISKNPHYDMGIINLKNHGFLMYASTIEELKKLCEKSIYIKRKIGKELI